MDRRESQPGGTFRKFNLADADQSASFSVGAAKGLPTAMDFLASIARRVDPAVGAWFATLSGGGLSSLVARLLRLRRVAGAMLHASLTPPLPVRLQIETTDVCNLRCIHCRREKMTDMNTTTLSSDAFAQIIADIQPLYVNMAGFGEPLIDRSIFAKLALLRERGIRSAFPTNGTYICRSKAEALAKELPDILQLSIDGATKESFQAIRKRADFERIVENYRALCDLRIAGKTRSGTVIRVLCALQRANLHDYRAMYRLIQTLPGIDSFGLVPVSHGSPNAAQVPNKNEILALHRELDEAIAATHAQDEKMFYRQWRRVSAEWLKGEEDLDRLNSKPNQAPCMMPWLSAYIDAKHRVYPCCHLAGSRHVMGTLNKDGGGFAEVWGGARYQSFRSDLMSKRPTLEGCRKCPRNDTAVISTLRKYRPLLRRPGAIPPR